MLFGCDLAENPENRFSPVDKGLDARNPDFVERKQQRLRPMNSVDRDENHQNGSSHQGLYC